MPVESKDELLSLLPEINEVSDEPIRDGVIDCFILAFNEGGFTVSDIDRLPFTLTIENCPVSLLEHIKGVTRTSLSIAKTLEEIYGPRIVIDRDILTAGALLHDVGKLVEYTTEDNEIVLSDMGRALRHPTIGAQLADEAGLPPEVIHIIAYHSWEGERIKRSIEAHIVYIADLANNEPFRIIEQ
ncbi:MAG: HD domain-containing protein [bacterium]